MSLRARLFVTMAIVLACAVAASSLLSRRATLVEVHQVVAERVPASGALEGMAIEDSQSVDELARRVAAVAEGATLGAATALLEEWEAASGRPIVLIDRASTIAAASNTLLASAVVTQSSHDGSIELRARGTDGQARIALQGVAGMSVTASDGRLLGHLVPLPPRELRGRADGIDVAPPWIVTTISIAVVALLLTFMLSRRVLHPVSALTGAVQRMERGDLNVRVAAPPRGGDEIAELGRAFNAMASTIGSNERARRQMVSDVAHELRSPVTNLRCTLEAMQDGLLPVDREGIDQLHEETLFLQHLIGDLQDLALAEAGRLILNRQTVDVSEIAQRAIAALAPEAGAPITLTTGPDVPRVLADPSRVEQILRNLLANARQHSTADQAISVAVHRHATDVVIEVADTGTGIDATHLPRVFDRFYRADSSRNRGTGGAGLGLAIVRQLVLAHGGRVEALSAGLGHGTTIRVRLPSEG